MPCLRFRYNYAKLLKSCNSTTDGSFSVPSFRRIKLLISTNRKLGNHFREEWRLPETFGFRKMLNKAVIIIISLSTN